jgi:hypothetical protein
LDCKIIAESCHRPTSLSRTKTKGKTTVSKPKLATQITQRGNWIIIFNPLPYDPLFQEKSAVVISMLRVHGKSCLQNIFGSGILNEAKKDRNRAKNRWIQNIKSNWQVLFSSPNHHKLLERINHRHYRTKTRGALNIKLKNSSSQLNVPSTLSMEVIQPLWLSSSTIVAVH